MEKRTKTRFEIHYGFNRKRWRRCFLSRLFADKISLHYGLKTITVPVIIGEDKISRHAKRRIQLYEISESVIINILEEKIFSKGKQELVEIISGFELPIKIVFNVTDSELTVITAYPLKKGRK